MKELFTVKVSFDIVVYAEQNEVERTTKDFFGDAVRDLSTDDLDLTIRPYPKEGLVGYIPEGWSDICIPYGYNVNDRDIGELK